MNRHYYLEKDSVGQPITPIVILANKSGRKIGVLNIDESSLVIKVFFEDSNILLSEMSCDIHKYINTYKNPLWDYVKDFKLLFIPLKVPHIKAHGFWYEIEVEIDESDDTVKHITGTLAQYAELSQSSNYDVEIRTPSDIDRDDYEDTVFYNPDNPDASIINRVLKDKASHYSIAHVDDSLKDIKRTFSFSGTSIINCFKNIAEEVDCIITFGESDNDDLKFHRTLSFYDAKDYCPVCGKRGDFSKGCTNPECDHSQKIIPRYGTDTGIFINKENLGENLTLSSNTDEIKNCFRLSAGDSDMTAAVINCNPSGSRYIWYFTKDMKQDMSKGLRTKINAYENTYNNYRYFYQMPMVSSQNINNYNNLLNKYQSLLKDPLESIDNPIIGYTKLMYAYYSSTYLHDFLNITMSPYSPDTIDTTAQEQIRKYTLTKIGVRALNGVSTTIATTEVEDSVKLYIDTSRYRVNITTTNYSKPTWTGTITLTSFNDENDTASVSKTITFTEATGDYIKNQVDKFIKKKEAMLAGIVQLLKTDNTTFENEIKKYALDYLTNYSQVIKSVLDILDDAGITASSQPDVYEQIYQPYSQKKTLIDKEIVLREQEVQKVQTLIDQIENQQKEINTALNLESYLGASLWLELLAFRREDVQENSNFISTGLTTAELIQNAQEFFDRADEDIAKRAESQYSISGDLKNLLVLLPNEYTKKYYLFDIGNWLRIEIDEKIYKLRLTSYEIDFGDLNTINVEFADVKKSNDIFSNFTSMINRTNNLEKGLSDISRQVQDNEDISEIINQITEVISVGANGSVATVKADSIMFDNDTSLEDYLKSIATDVNGALALTLSNEFQAIATNEFGEDGDYSDCQSSATLTFGLDDITNDNSVTWNIYIPDNVTATWDENNHFIAVNNVTGDYGIIEIKAIYNGLEVRKNFTVKKIKSGSSPVIVEIESSAGNIFKNRGINTILTATVKKGNQDISDTVLNYHWIKYDQDGNLDPNWSRLNTRTITLSPADLWSKAVFTCEVSFE